MIESRLIHCPYCGEHFDTDIDCSAGSQTYFEDCYVCCRPILFETVVENGELMAIQARREDD